MTAAQSLVSFGVYLLKDEGSEGPRTAARRRSETNRLVPTTSASDTKQVGCNDRQVHAYITVCDGQGDTVACRVLLVYVCSVQEFTPTRFRCSRLTLLGLWGRFAASLQVSQVRHKSVDELVILLSLSSPMADQFISHSEPGTQANMTALTLNF